jgi:hypothetical protein
LKRSFDSLHRRGQFLFRVRVPITTFQLKEHGRARPGQWRLEGHPLESHPGLERPHGGVDAEKNAQGKAATTGKQMILHLISTKPAIF